MRIIVVGTAYHPKDLLHELAAQPRFQAVRFPIVDVHGQIAWPEFWPKERIEGLREELGPAEFARQLLCQARDDDESRFKMAWIEQAMRRGEGLQMVHHLDGELSEGWGIYTGVDIGVKKTRRSDLTAFFTFLEDPKGHRTVLWIESGKFTLPEIVERIEDHHRRYRSLIAVENNAQQDFVLQYLEKRGSRIPVQPHTTTKAKKDPLLGVEGLAVELHANRWTIPCIHNRADPEVNSWIEEMLFYTPQNHTGDRLMASYFAREIARKTNNKTIPTVAFRTFGEADEAA
jgi:hypothetical protein